jgi:hypothetical protein
MRWNTIAGRPATCATPGKSLIDTQNTGTLGIGGGALLSAAAGRGQRPSLRTRARGCYACLFNRPPKPQNERLFASSRQSLAVGVAGRRSSASPPRCPGLTARACRARGSSAGEQCMCIDEGSDSAGAADATTSVASMGGPTSSRESARVGRVRTGKTCSMLVRGRTYAGGGGHEDGGRVGVVRAVDVAGEDIDPRVVLVVSLHAEDVAGYGGGGGATGANAGNGGLSGVVRRRGLRRVNQQRGQYLAAAGTTIRP